MRKIILHQENEYSEKDARETLQSKQILKISESKSLGNKEELIEKLLLFNTFYFRLTQIAYAIVAFPIGTVLSIAPIFLNEERNVSVEIIGYVMAVGELLGIAAMKIAEISDGGFILKRPNDLNLIVLLLSISLILLPVFPNELWFFSGVSMMTVQIFNSASKPVIGEALHRMADVVDTKSAKAFAEANMIRRVGNGVIGALSPIIYIISASSFFYGIGCVMLVFLIILIYAAQKDKKLSFARSLHDHDFSEGSIIDNMSRSKRFSFSSCQDISDFEEPSEDEISDETSETESTHHSPINEKCGKDDVHSDVSIGSIRRAENFLSINEEWVCSSSKEGDSDTTKNCSGTIFFMIVHITPFLDAAISRLPFAFLTIVIAKQSNMYLAAGILFAYQMSRALSQLIQGWKCFPKTGYILNVITLVAFITLVTYVEIYPNGDKWYIPFPFVGLAETLPIQQFYLNTLFSGLSDNDLRVRHAVKASHTATGIGSMVAFVASSQIYTKFDIHGIAYLGLSIQTSKVLINIVIDFLGYEDGNGAKSVDGCSALASAEQGL